MQFGEISVGEMLIRANVIQGTVHRGTAFRGTIHRGTVRRGNIFGEMSVAIISVGQMPFMVNKTKDVFYGNKRQERPGF